MMQSVRFIRVNFIFILFATLFLNSCYYDNLEELHPSISTANCDTTGTISYTNDIVPILNSSCGIGNSCHSGTSSYPMDTYNNVYVQATAGHASCTGVLVLAIKHDPCVGQINYMPSGGGSLDSCSIKKIEAWVNRGSPNN